MDKQQIVSFIEGQLALGKITKQDLATLVQGSATLGSNVPANDSFNNSEITSKEDSSKNLINVFYAIGAIIAIVGVGILVAQNWDQIGFGGRIIVTLGISLVSYIAALILRNPEQKNISQIMFTIAATLAPLGAYILLKEAGIDFDRSSQLIVACILSVVFGTALFISKKNILLLITTGFITWAYYATILQIFDFNYYDNNVIKWASMLLGVAYLFVGYGLKSVLKPADISDEIEKKRVQNVLYAFGTLAILGAGVSIGGIFDLVVIALIFGAFYGSVYLKSRAMLIFGALFLMGHIIKLTSKYFVDSVGWPVALIVIGFLVIGVGYMTFYLNRKYLSAK